MHISDNLDKIQGLVEKNFKDIKNTNPSCSRFPDQPCTSEHLQVQFVPLNFLANCKVMLPGSYDKITP